jgi:hypothetical protein
MSDSALQRLVVRGVPMDVEVFTRAGGTSARPDYITVKRQLRTQKLSFIALTAQLPVTVARRVARDSEEPWDLVLERSRLGDGTVEVTYKFQLSRFECAPLIVAISTRYPRLCFVLGCVAPSVDQQSSLFIHNGHSWSWTLPNRRKRAIWAKVPKETNDNADEVTWRLAEADWAMMDAVVDHWAPKANRLMATLMKQASTSRAGRRRR